MIDYKKSARYRMSQALIEEMKHTNYKKIKVSDIIRQADVNRSTFYRNYDDIFDMYKQTCNEYIDYIIEPVKLVKHIDPENREGIFNYIKEYKEYVEKCIPSLKILISDNGDYSVIFEFADALKEETEKIGNEILGETKADLRVFCDGIAYYFTLLIMRNCITPASLERFEGYDFNFDLNKSFVDNGVDLIASIFKDYNQTTVKKLILYIFKCWKNKEFYPYKISEIVKVSDLMNHMGMSRTIFYKAFENMVDLVRFFYSAFAYVFSNYMFILLSSNRDEVNTLLRNKDKEKSFFKENVLLDVMNTPAFLNFITSTVDKTIELLNLKITSKIGEINKRQSFCIDFYVTSIITMFFEYLLDFDTEKFVKKFNMYFDKLEEDGLDLS